MSFKLPPLQTVTQCASLVTATRAIWELSRMVRQKKREVDETKEVEDLLDEIEEFVHEGVLTKREWKAFCFNVEEALSKKECTPREAQAKVLDFLEALHSIAQEFQEEDGAYLSEPEDVGHVPRRRIEEKGHPRRDSAINTSRESHSRTHAAVYPPSPSVARSQTAHSPDLRPRRASAPLDHHHYHAPSPGGQMDTGPVNPGDPSQSIPRMPVALPSQFQNSQQYRPPRHSFASPSATPGASGAFSPGAGASVVSPGHMLPNQPTYYPNAPPSLFTPGTTSPFAAGAGASGTASRPYVHRGPVSPVGPASPTFNVNDTASPPPPNYSGPLPVPPSRFTQQRWGPSPTQASGGPNSPASTIPAQNTWSNNTTFPFPSFPESQSRSQSNANSTRPSAAPTPSRSHSSPSHRESTASARDYPPEISPSNSTSSPVVPPSPDGSTSAHVNGWDSRQGSPRGFMSPTQEAQAQRAAAAKLRDHERQQRQAQALSEEIGVPDFDIPPPPNAPRRQQRKPQVNWASSVEDDWKVNDTEPTNPPPDSVSEAGTYMNPTGEKNKRRRRRQ